MEDLLSKAPQIERLLKNALVTARAMPEPCRLYWVASSLQIRDLTRSAVRLIPDGHVSAAWLCVRSISELVIRLRWIGKTNSRARAVILSDEITEPGRLRSDLRNRRLKSAAIAALEKRIDSMKVSVPKYRTYWDRSKQKFKKVPDTCQMAIKSGSKGIYYSYFRYASWHVHAHQQILARFILEDEASNNVTLFLEPISDERTQTAFSLLNLALLHLTALSRAGFTVDLARVKTIEQSLKG